jgi:uncharacterized phiE125 gp8 family phage protein
MGLQIVTAPANLPVDLDTVKKHLRVDFTDDDTLIDAYLEAAVGYVDGPNGFLGRALIAQTWDYYLDRFPVDAFHRRGGRIELPLPPLIEVIGVFYLDASGAEQTLDPSRYTVDSASVPARLYPVGGCWPTIPCLEHQAVRIRFTAGYVDASVSPPVDDVPKPIIAAIMLLTGDLYANRETMLTGQRAAAVTLPWAAEQLLRPHRVTLSMA